MKLLLDFGVKPDIQTDSKLYQQLVSQAKESEKFVSQYHLVQEKKNLIRFGLKIFNKDIKNASFSPFQKRSELILPILPDYI